MSVSESYLSSLGSSSLNVGGCAQYGTYEGNGGSFGANPAYSVYRVNGQSNYTLNVVNDATCQLIASYPHAYPAGQAPSSGSGTGSSTTPSSGSSSTTPKSTTNPTIAPYVAKYNTLLWAGIAAAGVLGVGLVIAGATHRKAG